MFESSGETDNVVVYIILNSFRQQRMMEIHDKYNQIKGAVDTYREFEVPRDETVSRIVARYGLKEFVAAGYVDEFLKAAENKTERSD